MIKFISGILEDIEDGEITVDVGGIGYGIFVPNSALEQLPDRGENLKIYTYLSVREDANKLYGFITKKDLKIFKLLISVNGIGPKVALGIMGSMTSDEIGVAVMSDDAKAIAKAPGIGAKTAQKVILELKDKMDVLDYTEAFSYEYGRKNNTQTDEKYASIKGEAIEALVVLGYGKKEAKKAVDMVEITENITVEDVLKLSLKNL